MGFFLWFALLTDLIEMRKYALFVVSQFSREGFTWKRHKTEVKRYTEQMKEVYSIKRGVFRFEK